MAVKEPTGGLKKACWKGYTAVGMKNKNGRKVPNCVPVKEESNEPKDREWGTTKLTKRYKKDTPGQCDCTQKEEVEQMDETKDMTKALTKKIEAKGKHTTYRDKDGLLKLKKLKKEEVEQIDELTGIRSSKEKARSYLQTAKNAMIYSGKRPSGKYMPPSGTESTRKAVKRAETTLSLNKMSEGYGAYAPKRYGSREDDWGHEPPDRDDKKFRFSGQTKNSWSHVYVNGEKVKEFHGASSHDDAAEHAYELLHKHKKAGQNHKIEIHDHSQPNTKIRVDEMNGIAKQPKAGVEKLVSKINPDKGAKVVKETRNVIREVIKKAVDKQETNKANGKTATGEPMPKIEIDPVISLDSNKGI